jgi:hypothetical protein
MDLAASSGPSVSVLAPAQNVADAQLVRDGVPFVVLPLAGLVGLLIGRILITAGCGPPS